MAQLVWGLLAIAVGALFCFRGYGALRTVIAIWGGFVGFTVGALLAAAATQQPPLAGPLGWVAAVLGAAVLGGLAYAFYAVAVILGVGSVGFALASGLAGLLRAPGWIGWVAGVAGAVALVALALTTDLPRVLLILVAASGGATAIVAGLMLLAGVLPLSALSQDAVADAIAQRWWLGLLHLGLFVAGVVVQFRQKASESLRAAYR